MKTLLKFQLLQGDHMSTAKIDRRVEPSHHFSSMEQEYEAGKQGTWSEGYS